MNTHQHSPLHLRKTQEEKCQAESTTTHLPLMLASVGKVRLMGKFFSLATGKTDLIACKCQLHRIRKFRLSFR